MSPRIAPKAPPHNARRPSPASWRRAPCDSLECIEAQMWCAAALSPCDIAVRADGRDARRCVIACALTLRPHARAAPVQPSGGACRHARRTVRAGWPGYC
ncbi:conserved hypothetical protein [Burkholderia ambifaria]